MDGKRPGSNMGIGAWFSCTVVMALALVGCPRTQQALDASNEHTSRWSSHRGHGRGHTSHGHGHGHHGDGHHDDAECTWEPYGEGLFGGSVHLMAADPRVEQRIYAASGTWLWRSDDGGTNWEKVAKAPKGLQDIGFSATDPAELLGATSLGVVRSFDGGHTWDRYSLDGLLLRALFTHPADGRLVFGTVPGAGLVRSRDAGSVWKSSNQGLQGAQINAFLGSPDNPADALVGATLLNELGYLDRPPDGGVYRTQDGGESWRRVLHSGRAMSLARCNMSGEIWAAGDNLHRSVDGGETWMDVPAPGNVTLGVTVSPDCRTILLSVRSHGMFRSHDGGLTWEGPLSDGLPTSSRGHVYQVLPPASDRDAFVIHGAAGAFRSDSDGERWSPIVEIADLVMHRIENDPNGGGALWLGTRGTGAWYRAPGESWRRLGVEQGLGESFIISLTPTGNGDEAYIGGWGAFWRPTADGYVSSDLQQNTTSVWLAEDGTSIAATSQVGGVHRSEDGGATWIEDNDGLEPFITPQGKFIDARSLLVDPVSGRMLLGTSGGGVYSRVTGEPWEPTAPILAGSWTMQLFATATHVYARTGDLGIARAPIGTEDFSWFNDGLPALTVVDSAYDPAGDTIISATDSGLFELVGDRWEPMAVGCQGASEVNALEFMYDGAETWLVLLTPEGVKRLLVE